MRIDEPEVTSTGSIILLDAISILHRPRHIDCFLLPGFTKKQEGLITQCYKFETLSDLTNPKIGRTVSITQAMVLVKQELLK